MARILNALHRVSSRRFRGTSSLRGSPIRVDSHYRHAHTVSWTNSLSVKYGVRKELSRFKNITKIGISETLQFRQANSNPVYIIFFQEVSIIRKTASTNFPQLNPAGAGAGGRTLFGRNLSFRRFRRFIFDSRCNREKYGTRINSFTPKNTGEGVGWQVRGAGERAKKWRDCLSVRRTFQDLG